MKNIIKNFCFVLSLCVLLASCSNSNTFGKTYSISGSTSVESLVKSFSEAYKELYPEQTFSFQGGGSGAAITSVESGITSVGVLSRKLTDSEKHKNFDEYTIAIDGIAVIANNKNDVSDLTLDQLVKIFKKEITNWSQVGGINAPIVLVGREAGSGTRNGFESILNIKEKSKYDAELSETGQVKSQVASAEGAIGYISSGYVDNTVKRLSVNGVHANEENIKSGEYIIQRPFIMIVDRKNSDTDISEFIKFVTGTQGQSIVRKKKFIPIT